MLHTISTWLVVAAFFGAGVFNAIGTSATRSDFVRWGYPPWWCRVTGALEIVTAALVAYPPTRGMGLILGAVIIAAAILTVLRHREYSHLTQLGPFVALLALAEIL
ncbi:DoxX family protein [Novosphingopyxis sp.]|uniref:DoxX family protein n=1 Tax=Novosphingopyxis sp. TaxID=2709690 RepID=UPI003B5C041D